MMQIREIRLVGAGKSPAGVEFEAGANVLSGDSDTGKSYMLRCLDFVLGAKSMNKSIEEAAGYDRVIVEFENATGEFMTLVRNLSGGDIEVHRVRLREMRGLGEVAKPRRDGKSKAPDISAVLLPFSGMTQAWLRKNDKGEKDRLTIRTLMSVCIVDENAIIAERSPVLGESGFDQTSRKRMFSYLLTGSDDASVVAEERSDIAQATVHGKLALIDNLLGSLESRLQQMAKELGDAPEESAESIERALDSLYSELEANRHEQVALQNERSRAVVNLQRAEAQLLAMGELLSRYRLLDTRYETDLRRLDFLSEGAHFFGQLQESRCPLCHQPMTAEHAHQIGSEPSPTGIYEASRAEAAKILGLRENLEATVADLESRRSQRLTEKADLQAKVEQIDTRITAVLVPELDSAKRRLDALVQRRILLESMRANQVEAQSLKTLRAAYESELKPTRSAGKKWESLDPVAVHQFCLSVESVLKEWSWKGKGHVRFDERAFDITVDGKPRQSHGKGVRAILHAAFLLGLLKYCAANGMPHPGFLVLDSPLTTFKQGRGSVQREEDKVDPRMELGFWNSLERIKREIQVVVIDNKEPPSAVAARLKFLYFAGDEAKPRERKGFIPQ